MVAKSMLLNIKTLVVVEDFDFMLCRKKHLYPVFWAIFYCGTHSSRLVCAGVCQHWLTWRPWEMPSADLIKIQIWSISHARSTLFSIIHRPSILVKGMFRISPLVRWCCWFGMGCRYHASETKTWLLGFLCSISLAW